jgi:hypothetical protein
MLAFADIEALVQAQHRVLISRYPGSAGALRLYRNGDSRNGYWFIAGVYAYLDPDTRLILEAPHLERFDACVIRVFTERPLTFFYERKAIGDISACSRKIAEAAEHFQLHLPKLLLRIDEYDAGTEFPEFDMALLPVPPPVSLPDVPE